MNNYIKKINIIQTYVNKYSFQLPKNLLVYDLFSVFNLTYTQIGGDFEE